MKPETKPAQHTPGPWQAYTGNTRDCVESVESGALVAIVYEGKDSPSCADNPIQKANARLIASAPELLNALQMVAELNAYAPNATRLLAAIEQAKATIEKATGGAK